MTAPHKKLQVLIFSGIAIIVTVILAAGLSGIRLQPGKPFPLAAFFQPGGGAVQLPLLGRLFVVLLRVLLFAVWILLPLAVIYFIVSPSARKRVLREFLALLPLFILLYLLLRASYNAVQGEEQQLQMPEVAPQISPLMSGPVLPGTALPEWFIFAASLAVAILIIAPATPTPARGGIGTAGAGSPGCAHGHPIRRGPAKRRHPLLRRDGPHRARAAGHQPG